MIDYHIPLLPGHKYHLLSRTIGAEKMFREATNYNFFLSRFKKHISSVANTYSYCLLPNHFHLMVRINEEAAIKEYFDLVKRNKSFSPGLAPEFMERFGNLLNSYTKAYNKMYKRKGSLFIDYLRRVEIETDSQFRSTVFYIHKNPVHHGYRQNIRNWQWSSYKTIISGKPSWLLCNEVLDWFGGIFHKQPIYLKGRQILNRQGPTDRNKKMGRSVHFFDCKT